ncbi:hypothetical protein QVD17_28849 [Tagetes erecta]|uniref:S-locus glycoprotein domain-containing protein n=1 Tax=Tagetes erecta TaxID=13708 RepID=A0AAD8NKS6_TARER|nr:hypothetical protein QVD17_28849 [Tagetes erecta]
MSDGTTMQLLWIDQIKDWAAYSIVASQDRCRYGLCGPYGSCNNNRYPPCKCLVGFRPRVPDEWDRANGSSGCERNKPLDCGSGDGFKKISGVKELQLYGLCKFRYQKWRNWMLVMV